MHKAVTVDDETWVTEIGTKLHDLAQPLTALQCRLEIGTLHEDPDAMRGAIEDALNECERLNKAVHTMQIILRRAMKGRQTWD